MSEPKWTEIEYQLCSEYVCVGRSLHRPDADPLAETLLACVQVKIWYDRRPTFEFYVPGVEPAFDFEGELPQERRAIESDTAQQIKRWIEENVALASRLLLTF